MHGQDGAFAELIPDEIVSIDCVGVVEVYDIEVEGTQTFVANGIAVHNCQDIDASHLPILVECLAASPWRLKRYTGTPKTLDNTIEQLWSESSQAEWVISCSHCTENGRPTLNIPSMDYHLDAMIGPWRTDISEERPAILCHKCRQPINPRPPFGRWLHRYSDLRVTRPGYHVPQIIMPMHCCDRERWAELLYKRESNSAAVFYNECLGESYDRGSKLINKTDLMAACTLPWENSWRDPDADPGEDGRRMLAEARRCTTLILGVDWGGGGEEQVSYTTLSLVGSTPEGRLVCLWGKKLLTPHDPQAEAIEIAKWLTKLRPMAIAHDYTGAGTHRELWLVQAGLPYERLLPIAYVRATAGPPVRYVEGTALQPRGHYRVDKPMSLVNTCQAIRVGHLRFFKYDNRADTLGDVGLIDHFLALVDDKSESRGGSDIYVIHRQQGMSDDFAQATNFACVAIWHVTGRWPDYARAAGVLPISEAVLRRACGDPGESVNGYFAV